LPGFRISVDTVGLAQEIVVFCSHYTEHNVVNSPHVEQQLRTKSSFVAEFSHTDVSSSSVET